MLEIGFASSIAEISIQFQAIYKYSQKLELMYVQEQIRANHWLLEIGRIKARFSNFEYANTREEILQILGHLALGLYELAESKDSKTDGTEESDKTVLDCLIEGILTILTDIRYNCTETSKKDFVWGFPMVSALLPSGFRSIGFPVIGKVI